MGRGDSPGAGVRSVCPGIRIGGGEEREGREKPFGFGHYQGQLVGPFEGFPSSKPVLLLKSDLPARGSQEILDTAPSPGLNIQWAH